MNTNFRSRSHKVMKRTGVVGLAAAGLLAGFSGSAYAASSSAIVYTNGTRAAEAWFNKSGASHSGYAWIDLYDAKCDGEPVYVEYKINNGSTTTKWNSGGCGSTAGFNLQKGSFAIVYRVCVDTFVPTCSPWKADNN
ncbi:hypothetical protein [Streptomyces sp.]|uniref:hypothetical protein n=1 Tax=Streptomyces sp. TaxID=1931 RepID=UPI002D79C9E8|nr:hypothetical protein [Streptomyces sp.]HET6354332.1 hypothetical protein [Streptomyces sp.]